MTEEGKEALFLNNWNAKIGRPQMEVKEKLGLSFLVKCIRIASNSGQSCYIKALLLLRETMLELPTRGSFQRA